MTKFDRPPLFQPRVEKNFDPPTSSLDPTTYKKSRPPPSILTIRSLAIPIAVAPFLSAFHIQLSSSNIICLDCRGVHPRKATMHFPLFHEFSPTSEHVSDSENFRNDLFLKKLCLSTQISE